MTLGFSKQFKLTLSDITTLNTIIKSIEIDTLFENGKFVNKKRLVGHIF